MKKRAAREPLSRGRIEAAALKLIEEVGYDDFSTRKLAAELGCEAMSIYHHFPSKQHLLDALVEHAISTVEVSEPGPDAPDRLRRSLYSYRAMARRFPALFPLVAVHRLNTPTGVIVAFFASLCGFAVIWYIWWLAAGSFVALLAVAIHHTFNYDREFRIPASDVLRAESDRTRLLAAGS